MGWVTAGPVVVKPAPVADLIWETIIALFEWVWMVTGMVSVAGLLGQRPIEDGGFLGPFKEVKLEASNIRPPAPI